MRWTCPEHSCSFSCFRVFRLWLASAKLKYLAKMIATQQLHHQHSSIAIRWISRNSLYLRLFTPASSVHFRVISFWSTSTSLAYSSFIFVDGCMALSVWCWGCFPKLARLLALTSRSRCQISSNLVSFWVQRSLACSFGIDFSTKCLQLALFRLQVWVQGLQRCYLTAMWCLDFSSCAD